ncbi:MAG: leucine-rich repeat domain-containing protein [Pseudomonadota bacterium]
MTEDMTEAFWEAQWGAYEEAEARIAKAREEQSEDLNLMLGENLVRLPPEIAELRELASLDLDGTSVSDLSPIQTLSALTGLDLSNNPYLSDLSSLFGLSGLKTLNLNNTGVSDLSPLSGLSGLQGLYLTNTSVNDLSPLSGLSGLQTLYLDNTGVSDLRPLGDLERFVEGAKTSLFGGLTFQDTPLTQLDPRFKELPAIEANVDRNRQTADYVATLGPDWPPLPEDPQEQDAVLRVVATDQGFDLGPSKPDDTETNDRLKQKAFERLKRAAADLCRAAGNMFPDLDDGARALEKNLDCEFEDLDVLDVHFELESLRAVYETRDERPKGEELTPKAVKALNDVLLLGPGLTLDNAEVQKLEDRRDRYRGRAPDPDVLAKQDALSQAIADAPETFAPRLRRLEEKVQEGSKAEFDRLRVGQESVNQNALVATGRWFVDKFSSGAVTALGATATAGVIGFFALNFDLIISLAPAFGEAFTAWITPILMRAKEAWAAVNSVARR